MTKNILEITDWDLQHVVMDELNLMDNEIISIRRDGISTTLFWSGENRKGFVSVLSNTIAMTVGRKVFYIGQKSVNYLLERGYDLGNKFFYNRGESNEEIDA